jgi:hypothetical protein
MKLGTVLTLNAIVAVLFGLGFVLVPGALTSLYGATLSAAGIYVARLFGAAVLGFAALAWFARDAQESVARRAIVLGLFVSWAVGLICALVGQLAGAVNALGWSTVVIYLLFALGLAYFQFIEPSAS